MQKGSDALVSSVNALRLYLTNGQNPNAWLDAFIASAIGGTCGLAFGGIQSVMGFLTSTSRLIMGKIQSVMHSLWAQGLNFFNIVGAAFAFLCKLVMIPVNIWLLMMTWNRIVELGGA